MNSEAIQITALVREAQALEADRQLAQAAERLEAAASAARADPVAKLMMLPSILARLGPILLDLAQYDKARDVLNEALTESEKLLGPDSADAVRLRGNLAALSLHEGRYVEARESLLAALKICRNAFPVDRIELARLLSNLSRACASLGMKDEAEQHIAEAYRILQPRAAPDDPLLGEVLDKVALSHLEAGRLGPALHFFQQARESVGKAFGATSLEYAAVSLEMARLLGKMLRYPDAIDVAKVTAGIRLDVLGPQHPGTIEALQTLGLLFSASSDLENAHTQLLAAYKMSVATHGQSAAETMFCLMDLLTVAGKVGEREDAEADLKNIIPVIRKVNQNGTPFLFRSLTDLAGLVESLGKTDEVKPLAVEAAAAAAALPPAVDRDLRAYFESLAGILLRAGETARGIHLLERMVKSDDWLIDQAIVTRDDIQRRFYLRRIAEGTATFITGVLDHGLAGDPAVAAAAYSFVANRKGLMAEAYMAQDDAQLVEKQPELAPLVDWVRDLRGELAEVQMAGSSRGVDELLLSSDALKTRLAAIDLEIEAKTKPELRATRRLAANVDTDLIRAALPTGTALVDLYAVSARSGSSDDDRKREVLERTGSDLWLSPTQPERYVAFVVHRDAGTRMIDLGEGAAIESLAYSYLAAMNQGRTDAVPRERQADVRVAPEGELSRDVRKSVFDPLRAAIGESRSILIAPDGATCRIPFAALLADAPEGRRLIDDVHVGYVTSARAMLRFGAAASAGNVPLVLADPDYDFVKGLAVDQPTDQASAPFFFYFPRLAGTADEGWTVSKLLETKPIRGVKANEAVLRGCHSPAVLHIATHGFYVRPFAQGVMVIGDLRHQAGARFGTFVRGQLMGYAENPYLRSGLALAGVNAWSAGAPLPEEVRDGLLTSAEIAHLDLRNTELVVLSACSTALGDVHPGEGVAGLLQGLQLAGARTIVAALWQIPDEATAVLMEAFYRALLREPRPTATEALEAAQSVLRKDGKPAWQWAAHVCYGDPAPLRYVPAAAARSS